MFRGWRAPAATGAGLVGNLRRCWHRVIEVSRGDRRAHRRNGKSDAGDAEAAARPVLLGSATAVPKSADGAAEMIYQFKTATDTARKSRSAAIAALKAKVVNAPPELRESLDGLTDKAHVKRCAACRVCALDNTTAPAKHSLRALARRWLFLRVEIGSHDAALAAQASPTLRDGYGTGPDFAARVAHRVQLQPRTDPLRGRLREALRDLSHRGL